MKHQITESHISDNTTPEQAAEVAANLTALGYPAEYNGMQGVASYLIAESGDKIEIPQHIWDAAISTL